jgi:hypothetical protein
MRKVVSKNGKKYMINRELCVLDAVASRIIWKSDKESYECKHCHYRQSLRANAIMHGSWLPFRYWFVAFQLVTSTKKSFSTKELQRQLGHKYYEPIWAMMHKIRAAMGERDAQYKLSGIIELDEGFFSTEIPKEEKDKPLKRGRGSQKKTKVLVMAESIPIEEEAGKKSKEKPRKVNHIKMFVIDDLQSAIIDKEVLKNVEKTSIIDSDDIYQFQNIGQRTSSSSDT